MTRPYGSPYTSGGGDACAIAGRDIDQVWNPTVRAAIADAFAATGKPFAIDTAPRVTARLDDYASAWAATARDACARDDDVQLACLRERRDDLAALARLLVAPDDKLAAHAIDAVAKLPPIARCDDLAALRREAAARPDPIATALRGQLSEVVASIAAGKRDRALVLARELAGTTENVGDPELRVAALSRLAEVEAAAGNVERARGLLEEAIATADRAGADRLRGEAWAQLISILSARRDDIALAKRLAPQAEAAVARLGPAVSPALEIKWLNANGTLLAATDPRAAADKFRQAAARAAATVGKTAPLYVETLERLAGAEQPLVTPQAHLDAMLKIVELDAQLYGEHHPATADQRLYLGEAYMLVGKPDDAIAALRRAAADLAGAYGDDDPSVADARTRLAGALQLVGKLPDAIAENERALAIRTKRFPPGSAFIIESLIQRGRLQGATGAWRDAIATLTGVRELAVNKLGPTDLQVAEIEKDLGYAYGHVDRFVEAEARYRHALELEEAALGRDSPALAGPLRQLGTVLVMAHKERDAIAPLERAHAILATGAGDPLDLADVRLQLGYALAGSDKQRALALANQALAEYTKQQIAEARDEASALVGKLSR